MKRLDTYIALVNNALQDYRLNGENHQLYKAIDHILNNGGKRIRPALCLMACELFGGRVEDATPAAMAVELFHNFTLLHDDIMDDAPLRRGQQTAHELWGVNQAILSGDALFVWANLALQKAKAEHLVNMLPLYNQTALEVCIGQQMDMEFENRNDVTLPEYIEMIRLKTSVLLGAALEMGATCANASPKNCKALYNFGVNLGIAFQLKDDYLDAFANPEEFGKQVGGDILADKKTYLMLRALELGNENQLNTIGRYTGNREKDSGKVDAILTIYEELNIREELNTRIHEYSEDALRSLDQTDLGEDGKAVLKGLAEWLINRTH